MNPETKYEPNDGTDDVEKDDEGDATEEDLSIVVTKLELPVRPRGVLAE